MRRSYRMRRSYQANPVPDLKQGFSRIVSRCLLNKDRPKLEEELEFALVGLRNVYLQHTNIRQLLFLHIYVHPVMDVMSCHYSYTCNQFSNGQWRLQVRAVVEEECDRLVSRNSTHLAFA